MLNSAVVVICLLVQAALVHADSGTPQCISTAPCRLSCAHTCPSNRNVIEMYGARSTRTPAAVPLSGMSQAKLLQSNSIMRMDTIIARVTAIAEQKAAATILTINADSYPVATNPSTGNWVTVQPGHWTSGFFPGMLWQLHSLTGKSHWAEAAQKQQAALAWKQRLWAAQHDFGFIYLPTYAHSYSVTHSRSDLQQALAAAEALAWNYNPATKSLRTFEGWQPARSTHDYKQIVIIDFMINIQMLVWGAKNVKDWGGQWFDTMDSDPATGWLEMATEHARQVAENHVRPDGSTYHIVEYEPDTGAVNARYTYQGHADNSTWARGQSWAVMGFAKMYQETGLPEFLKTAQKVTDKWLQLLVHQSGAAAGSWIPLWDFNAPYDPSTDGPRDTSAAAVAALGMLHLYQALGDTECGQKYLCAAVNTLRALASPKYLATPGEAHAGLLKHATGNLPSNDKIDVGLIYADYYYLQALQVCSTIEACRIYGA